MKHVRLRFTFVVRFLGFLTAALYLAGEARAVNAITSGDTATAVYDNVYGNPYQDIYIGTWTTDPGVSASPIIGSITGQAILSGPDVVYTTTGRIAGRPIAVGTFYARLTVKFYVGDLNHTLTTATKDITITVLPATATLALGNLSQTYSGSAKTVTVTSSPAEAKSAVTYNSSTTAPINAGSYSVTATVADANYTGSPVSGTLLIAKANQTVSISVPPNTKIGVPVTLSATTTSGLPVTFSIGSGNATVNGSTLICNDANPIILRATQAGNENYNAATGSYALTLAKLNQSVAFADPGAVARGTSVSLSATASSGLPVSYAVISGNATLSGSSLVLNDYDPVVIRATQSGDGAYNAASADLSLRAIINAQTIAFTAPATKNNGDAPFALQATSSSGLPVTLTLVSGPATLSGSTLTLTGLPGTVVLRASQAGDNVFLSAADVTQSITVGSTAPLVYFGSLGTDGKAGDFAIYYDSAKNSGTLVGFTSSTSEGFAVDFTLDGNGDFAVARTTYAVTAGPSAAEIGATRTTSANATARTFHGHFAGTAFTGTIDGLALPLAGTLVAPSGNTASLVGYYRASALDAASGSTSVIVAANGQAYSLAVSDSSVSGARGTITTAGAFTVQSTGSTTITGTVDATSHAVSGSVTTGSSTATFAGLSSTVTPVQRMVNLSMRCGSGAGDDVLIAGFSVTGSAPKQLLLRGVGPALSDYGVSGVLPNPRVRLYRGGDIIAENDNWSAIPSVADLNSATARTGAFPLTSGSKDAAIYLTVDPGNYSLMVYDTNASGIALAEVYDAGNNPGNENQRLVNLSARGRVGTGDAVLIGGFVVTGNSPKKLLVRGVGAGLIPYGVTAALPDPIVRVYRGGTLIIENDNWDATAANTQAVNDASARSGAFALKAGSKDAAVVTTLMPGNYSIVLSGPANTTGIALLELYELSD